MVNSLENRSRNRDTNTEKRILDAATEVFRRKGMEGSRMQEIADVAGINKALLHYYFRNKEKLFYTIFEVEFEAFFPQMFKLFAAEIPVSEKMAAMIDTYFDMLITHPFLPQFIITEINRNPLLVIERFDKMASQVIQSNLHKMERQMKEEEIKGMIRPMDPRHLLTNLISLCIFPFIAKPLIKPILFEDDPKKYDRFLKEKKAIIKGVILDSIKP